MKNTFVFIIILLFLSFGNSFILTLGADQTPEEIAQEFERRLRELIREQLPKTEFDKLFNGDKLEVVMSRKEGILEITIRKKVVFSNRGEESLGRFLTRLLESRGGTISFEVKQEILELERLFIRYLHRVDRPGFIYIPELKIPPSQIVCKIIKVGGATICAITIFGQTAEILLPYEKQKQYEKFVECLNLYSKIRFKNNSGKSLSEEEKQLLWYLHCQKHLDNEAITFLDEWLKSFPVRTIMSLGVNLFTEPMERELERRKGWQRQTLVQALNDRIKNAHPTELEQLKAIINHSSQLTPGKKRRLRGLIEEQRPLDFGRRDLIKIKK